MISHADYTLSLYNRQQNMKIDKKDTVLMKMDISCFLVIMQENTMKLL